MCINFFSPCTYVPGIENGRYLLEPTLTILTKPYLTDEFSFSKVTSYMNHSQCMQQAIAMQSYTDLETMRQFIISELFCIIMACS
jgi:hypothetical protein